MNARSWTMLVASLVLVAGSIALAWNDPGESGGGRATPRVVGETLRPTLELGGLAPTTTPRILLTEEDEMQYLQRHVFAAQLARRDATPALLTDDVRSLAHDDRGVPSTAQPLARALTVEEELQFLHEESFRARQAQRLAAAARAESMSWLTRDLWQFGFAAPPHLAQSSVDEAP
jgi:hypothetical protein